MKRISLMLISMLSVAMIAKNTTDSSESILSRFEKSKIKSLNSKNDKQNDVNNRWKVVIDDLTLSIKHAEQLSNATDKINIYAQVANNAEKDLVKIPGKAKSQLSKFRKVSIEAQNKSDGKLHRFENLVKNILKELESSLDDAKKDIETNSKELIEAQKSFAKEDATKATERPSQISFLTKEKKEKVKTEEQPKKEKVKKDKKIKKSKKAINDSAKDINYAK